MAEVTDPTSRTDENSSAGGSGAPANTNFNNTRSVWNPAQTRVFDVYVENGTPQTSQLLDIFACEEKNGKRQQPESSDDSEQEVGLENTGAGRSTQAFSGDAFERSKIKKQKLGSKESVLRLSLPSVKLDSNSTSYPVENSSSSSSSGFTTHSFASEQMAFAQTDKWPTQMESAFLAALRLIIKNGTSKFKIHDKNYGRNELISLFVQYHTGEVRTKKQISSHIQVWKKSISNKISSNIKISELDREILRLIEEGAAQTNESLKLFYSSFEEIISVLAKRERSDLSMRPSDRLQHPPYLTPAQSAVSNNKVQQYTPTNGFSPQPLQDAQLRVATPATPLDYAKSIYGNLKSYKCVPVKVQDAPIPHPAAKTPQHVYRGALQKELNSSVLQSAKTLELQQRQLIENLSHTPNSVKLPPVSPDLYVRTIQHPYLAQQPIYATPSQGLTPAPLSHYPITNNRFRHSVDHVPAGMVLPAHANYQQPQVYVPISAAHGPAGNGGNFQFTRMSISEQPRMQVSTPSSSSPSSPNDPAFKERGQSQVDGTKR